MAINNKRIPELQELTSIALDDYYIIVDVSDTPNGKTKKVSHQTLSDAVGGVGAINADNITEGTLADARLSTNVTTQGNTFNAANQLVKLDGSGKLPGSSYSDSVTLEGNIFNGSNQLVQLDSVGKYPSNDGSQITNLNASNLASGAIDDTLIPITIPRTKKIVTPLTTATNVNLTDNESNRLFVCSHTTGTMIFNLDIIISAGAYFTIVNTNVGDIQIQSAGQILSPSAVGNVSLIGRSPGGRRVEVICIDPASFLVSGDLLP
jgi:hypothetical protein